MSKLSRISVFVALAIVVATHAGLGSATAARPRTRQGKQATQRQGSRTRTASAATLRERARTQLATNPPGRAPAAMATTLRQHVKGHEGVANLRAALARKEMRTGELVLLGDVNGVEPERDELGLPTVDEEIYLATDQEVRQLYVVRRTTFSGERDHARGTQLVRLRRAAFEAQYGAAPRLERGHSHDKQNAPIRYQTGHVFLPHRSTVVAVAHLDSQNVQTTTLNTVNFDAMVARAVDNLAGNQFTVVGADGGRRLFRKGATEGISLPLKVWSGDALTGAERRMSSP